MGFFDKIKSGLSKTRKNLSEKINQVMNMFTKIDEDFFEELEEILITGDVGIKTSQSICDILRKKVKSQGITNTSEIKSVLKDIISDMLSKETDNELLMSTHPSIILVVGVNGVGKTTTIGKLAYNLKKEGKSVLLCAADTFRAGAIEQLSIWAERSECDIVKQREGADPASVVFDSISRAKARNIDVIICDTAGRLHNKKNLMEELSKINRIIDRELPDSSKEVLLVLDATTGQNAINQAKEFKDIIGVTGIALTKLDGTAKGGVVIPIKEELSLPVKLIGVGEGIDDLQVFKAEDFANALFD